MLFLNMFILPHPVIKHLASVVGQLLGSWTVLTYEFNVAGFESLISFNQYHVILLQFLRSCNVYNELWCWIGPFMNRSSTRNSRQWLNYASLRIEKKLDFTRFLSSYAQHEFLFWYRILINSLQKSCKICSANNKSLFGKIKNVLIDP